MMKIQDHFLVMMRKAWPNVPQGCPQWDDLENAYYGGALVVMNELMRASAQCTEEEAMTHLKEIEKQIEAHHVKTHQRVTLFAAIISAGRKPPDEPKMQGND